MLSAKLARSESGGVVHHLKLVLSHGTMPDSTYEARACALVLLTLLHVAD